MKFIISLIILFTSYSLSLAQDVSKNNHEIKWLSFEEAIKKNETEPKKFLIDVWTTWCGWCKKMDATTFQDPKIIELINKNFHPVKLNAERKDSVFIGGQLFINENPTARRSAHQLAISLLNGKMTYPSIVYLDEQVNMLQPIAGYQDPKSIEPILLFFGEDIYKTTDWATYQTQFKSSY
ncbi:MAG: DUF255 domain-containing protein [Bacteroidetes bacterium]|nr:MAG: DUF255 domain-containing protein [Bacteroidota bacterium]MBL1145027.1 DUF255 domain-containing protein [Bacteroidota bacterium]NOG57824.1 DUF255 domain-containing protein [Bacteroidota bacterium]